MSSTNSNNEIEDDYFHTYGVYAGYVDSESLLDFSPPNKTFIEQISNKIVNNDKDSICLLLIAFEYDKVKKKYFALIREIVSKKYSNIFDEILAFETALDVGRNTILKIGEEVTIYGDSERFRFEKSGHVYHGSFQLSMEVLNMRIGEKTKYFEDLTFNRPNFSFRFISFRPTGYNSNLFT